MASLLGVSSPFVQGSFFSENHQKPRGNSRWLKRTMVEKNRESTPRSLSDPITRFGCESVLQEGVVLHVQQGLNLSNSHAEEDGKLWDLLLLSLGQGQLKVGALSFPGTHWSWPACQVF